MNKAETLKIIYVIKSTFPKVYEKFSSKDFENMADTWAYVFEDYSYQEISLGLKAYLTTNASGFPPVPAQLIELSRKSNPMSELTSNEAWSLVYKAICNSNYNAEAEFNKLPELCQKAIGSPASLKELASMDADTVKSVEGSHFKRNYETLVKRKNEYEKIPERVRLSIERANQSLLEVKNG